MDKPSEDSGALEREGAFLGAPALLFTQPGMMVAWIKVVAAVAGFAIAATEVLSLLIVGPQGDEWLLALAGLLLLPVLAVLVMASTW